MRSRSKDVYKSHAARQQLKSDESQGDQEFVYGHTDLLEQQAKIERASCHVGQRVE